MTEDEKLSIQRQVRSLLFYGPLIVGPRVADMLREAGVDVKDLIVNKPLDLPRLEDDLNSYQLKADTPVVQSWKKTTESFLKRKK